MLNQLIASTTSHATPAASAELSSMDQILNITIDLGIVVIVFGMLLCVIQLLRSPHLADRALAADTMGVELIGLVILLGMRFMTGAFIDGVLVLSLLSFAGTVAMAQFIARPHLRHDKLKADEKLEDLA